MQSTAAVDNKSEMLSIGKLGKGQERYYLDYADPCVMPTLGQECAL